MLSPRTPIPPHTSKCTPRASALFTRAALKRKASRFERSMDIRSAAREVQASAKARSVWGWTARRS